MDFQLSGYSIPLHRLLNEMKRMPRILCPDRESHIQIITPHPDTEHINRIEFQAIPELYHDDRGDVEAYAKRAYVSVPLRQYTSDIGESVIIYFSFHTYDGEVQTYQFEYVPSHLTINY